MAGRILIIGGPGSGKTTLAARLSERMGIGVHHLDEVARLGGGRGPETSAEERRAAIDAILALPEWIAEGVHLGWTEPLLTAAGSIVWLDHVAWHRSSGRILRRFVGGALAEARQRRGRERFLRLRDYGRRLRELVVSLPETRSYPHAELEAALEAYSEKVIRCRTAAEVVAAAEAVADEWRPA